MESAGQAAGKPDCMLCVLCGCAGLRLVASHARLSARSLHTAQPDAESWHMPIEQREARGPRSRRTRSVAAKFVFQAAMLLQHCSMYACCASQRGHNLYSTETLRGAPTHPDTRIRVRRIIAGSVATLSLVAAIATVTVGAHPRTGKHYSAMPFHSQLRGTVVCRICGSRILTGRGCRRWCNKAALRPVLSACSSCRASRRATCRCTTSWTTCSTPRRT